MNAERETPPEDDRRSFLKKCGQFAVITPPTVTFLLSTSMSSKAIAASSGRPSLGGSGGSGAGLAGVGAGAAVLGAGALVPGQTAAPVVVAPVAAPPPLVAAPPPPPPVAPPPPMSAVAGERG